MATIELHREIKNWNDLDNLIELVKFQYSHAFSLFYWAIGIFFILFTIILQRENLVNIIGWQIYLTIMLLLTIIILVLFSFINSSHKKANENMEYLLRKKDGQSI